MSGQHILPILDHNLALGQKLVHGGAEFRYRFVQMQKLELVVSPDNPEGLLPLLRKKIAEALMKIRPYPIVCHPAFRYT